MGEKAVVLVIDDNEDLRENLAEILGQEGHEAWLAPTADAALRLLEAAPRAPDLVLIDVFMPGMTARRFISLVKDRSAWARVRIFLFTAGADSDVPADAQADGVLHKPLEIDRLLELLPGASRRGPWTLGSAR